MYLLTGCGSVQTLQSNQNVDYYSQGKEAFARKDYKVASRHLGKYLDSIKGKSADGQKVFSALNSLVHIYLYSEKRPDKVEGLLTQFIELEGLNDAQEDSLEEWIHVAKSWNKSARAPQKKLSADKLFEMGKKFYQRGMAKNSFEADDKGNADFYIAKSYLTPFVFYHDARAELGEALLMLGKMRIRSGVDYDYWSENFYLKEVIRRFPRSDLSWKAYQSLETSIRLGYTGSGGDQTPFSQLQLLKDLKVLATPQKAVKRKNL
jgi:hypothetical protein